MTVHHLNLLPFCGKDSCGARLSTPFSRGEYTWATNGKIMVRVPRRDDIPERKDAPHAERVWPDRVPLFVMVKQKPIQKITYEKCIQCNGRGHAHKCPDCQCTCLNCDGTGRLEHEMAVAIGERAVNLSYALLMMTLPSLEVDPAPLGYLLQFRFSGGEGILSLLSPTHRLPVCDDMLSEVAS